MVEFTVHSKETAPEGSKEILTKMEGSYGFVPNLGGVMAESPAMVNAAMAMAMNFMKSSLNPIEQQLVLITVSAVNGCQYCVASHSMAALKAEMDEATLKILRTGGSVSDPRLEVLRAFAVSVVEKRGWVDDAEVEAFMSAGYNKQNLLDVLLGIAYKTMTNYTNHISHTQINPQMESQRWDKGMYKA